MKIVYADMCADLFHVGHVRFLRQCKEGADKLIVGIHSDETIQSYKRKPVMSMQYRLEMVEACKYVDSVIPDAPLVVQLDRMKKLGVTSVIHATGISAEDKKFMYGQVMHMYREVPRTKGISTSEIIEKILASSF